MSTNILDKVGSIGAVVAGAAVPCCFPFLSLAGSILGLTFLAKYESVVMYVLQGMVLVALVGSFIAYRGHRKIAPLILSIISTAAIVYGLNVPLLEITYVYSGMVGLLIVAVWNTIEGRRCVEACKVP